MRSMVVHESRETIMYILPDSAEEWKVRMKLKERKVQSADEISFFLVYLVPLLCVWNELEGHLLATVSPVEPRYMVRLHR